jgi:hypothetical protein
VKRGGLAPSTGAEARGRVLARKAPSHTNGAGALRGAGAAQRPGARGRPAKGKASRGISVASVRRRRRLRRAALLATLLALALGLWGVREWRRVSVEEEAAIAAATDAPTKPGSGKRGGDAQAKPDEDKPAAEPPATAAQKRAPKKPLPKVAPPTPVASQRALVLAAIQARADDLRACERPPGAATRVPTRIRVAHSGKVRGVGFNTKDLPAPYADCLRKRINAWSFVDVGLQSDVNVLVDFALDARPASAATGAGAPGATR